MNSLREKLRRFADEIADAIEANGAGDWVDQSTSPLGRARHLALARAGKIPSRREGRSVFVRRADIDRYLDSKRVVRVDENAEEEREVAKVVTSMMSRRRAG